MSALREALRELPDAVFADVLESEGAYLLVFDLPGVTADEVELSVEGGLLTVTITGTQNVPEVFEPVVEGREEYRSFEIPVPLDATGDGAEASVERGELELTLPKRTGTASRTIPVTE